VASRIKSWLALGMVMLMDPLALGRTHFEDEPLPKLTCDDVLFGNLPMPDDQAMNPLWSSIYPLCVSLLCMKALKDHPSPQETQADIEARMQSLETYIRPFLTAIRVGSFTFRKTDLRYHLNDSQLQQYAPENSF
jgi:hypothetical protein